MKTVKYFKANPPWLTDNIKLLIKMRDKALSKFKKTRNNTDWEYYKTLRNQTNVAVRNEKKSYLTFCLRESHSKALWKKLSNLNIHTKLKNKLPNHLDKPEDINQNFLRHTGQKIPANTELKDFYENNLKTNFDLPFEFELISDNMLYKYLLEIKSKSTGSDGINIEMLLFCCPVILPYLVHIINSCILENYYPDVWKIARVIPLPKKSDAQNLDDLRPISILPTLSKVFEKVLNYQIKQHLDKYNILPNSQSGFRSGFSCATALLDVTDNIFKEIDNGNASVLVLLDYSKAFDTINHSLMLAILHFIGFSANAIELMAIYLKNRSQFVETVTGVSSEGVICRGVPQGAILSPILFCLYTCNISSQIEHCNIYQYADDTQIQFSFHPDDAAHASDLINNDLNKLVSFSVLHQLSINPTKSAVLVFGKNKNQVQEEILLKVDNTNLQCTKSAKNLGIELDNELRFKLHVSKCIQKSYGCLKLLYPHRHLLNQQLKIKLTDTLVLSLLNYCDVLYGPCLDKKDINRIERVQKSCLRFIYGIRRHQNISYKLKSAKWLNMATRRQFHSLKLFHRIIINKCPPYLYNKISFRTDVHSLNLRFKSRISPPAHKTAIFQRSFSYNVYALYNKLPPEIKKLKPASFSFSLKRYLLNSY